MDILRNILIFLFLFLTSCCFSQISGYQGKRFIFKVDVATPILINGVSAELEYVLMRNVSISLGYTYSDTKFNNNIEAYKLITGSYPSKKAVIQDQQLMLGLNFYHSKVIPAPKGSYTLVRYDYGRSFTTGQTYYVDNSNPQLNGLRSFEVSNVRTSKFSVGFGYQEVFFDRLTLDFSFGGVFGTYDAKTANNLVNSYGDLYGPNLYSFGRWQSDIPGGFGLFSHLKVGILLF